MRRAVAEGVADVEALRQGRVSLDALPQLRRLREAGALRPSPFQPSLARSLSATGFGTSASTSPPSFAASLMRLEET